MASTFSTSLRLELIGDGDQSGIWGQTTNTNLGTLLEQAVTGVVGITMTDANYTMSNFNGVSDESRNAVLVVGGTNTAQRNLVAPLVEKQYVVKNSTTGGFGVQIIGATGTGVVIPNGVTASVYCDGTNFYASQVNTVGSQTINGNLTVTGTTSLVGNAFGAAGFDGTTVIAQGYGLRARMDSTNTSAILQFTNNAASTQIGTISANAGSLTLTPPTAGIVVVNGPLAANSASFTTALPVLSGGTGTTTSTGTGSVVLSASPTFTGTPLAPTANAATNTTQIATTAFVTTAVTNATASLGTMSTQNANAVAITGGTIDGATIGATTAASVRGTTGTFTGALSATTGTFSAGVSGTTGTFSGAVSGTTGAFSGILSTTSRVQASSPNSGATGAIQLFDASGNPDAVYIQGVNNAGNASYATLKLNANGTVTPSGNIVGNVTGNVSGSSGSCTGNAATATAPASGGSFVTSSTKLGLGITGEVWTNISRSANTDYTNTYGYPIMVTVSVGYPAAGANSWRMDVNGVAIAYESGNPSNDTNDSISFIVPTGAVYRFVNLAGSTSFVSWSELA